MGLSNDLAIHASKRVSAPVDRSKLDCTRYVHVLSTTLPSKKSWVRAFSKPWAVVSSPGSLAWLRMYRYCM